MENSKESFYPVTYESALSEYYHKIDLKKISEVEVRSIVTSMTRLSMMYHQLERFSEAGNLHELVPGSDSGFHRAVVKKFRDHLYETWDEYRMKLCAVGFPYEKIPFLLKRSNPNQEG